MSIIQASPLISRQLLAGHYLREFRKEESSMYAEWKLHFRLRRDLTGLEKMINKINLNRLQQVFSPVTKINSTGRFCVALVVVFMFFSATVMTSANSGSKNERVSLKAGDIDIGVDNFGKVTDFYYRGAQPEADEYGQLASIGVRTIIDLRDDPKDYARPMTLKAGMKYLNLPMSDKRYPDTNAAEKFLNLVNDCENWPVYVHCAGGRHRTGAMTAVFRMKMQGWGIDQAYEEMKDYDFYTRWGHKAMKTFVYDYYRGLTRNQEANLKKYQIADGSSIAR